jgi:DNA mismatch endonuclease (patch repair protein)
MGYRFRIHVKNLPGKPDIVLPKYKAVIFVHGCFWHLHENCRDGTVPKTRTAEWKAKLERNTERDRLHSENLTGIGWKVIVVWECEVEKDIEGVRQALSNFLLGAIRAIKL